MSKGEIYTLERIGFQGANKQFSCRLNETKDGIEMQLSSKVKKLISTEEFHKKYKVISKN
jgi:hypothetical protein